LLKGEAKDKEFKENIIKIKSEEFTIKVIRLHKRVLYVKKRIYSVGTVFIRYSGGGIEKAEYTVRTVRVLLCRM
jgi:hypothetical protein